MVDNIEYHRIKQGRALDNIFNAGIVPFFGFHLTLIGLCFLIRLNSPSYKILASEILTLLTLHLLILYLLLNGIASRRCSGLPGLIAMFAVLATMLSPLPQTAILAIATLMYALLIGGVYLNVFLANELRTTPLYIAAFFLLYNPQNSLAFYFSLLCLGVWTLWRKSRLENAAGFFIAFIGIILYTHFYTKDALRLLDLQLIVVVAVSFLCVTLYGVTITSENRSPFYNFLIHSIVAWSLFSLMLLWWGPSNFLGRGYWWPIAFVAYLSLLYIIRAPSILFTMPAAFIQRHVTGYSKNETVSQYDILPTHVGLPPTCSGTIQSTVSRSSVNMARTVRSVKNSLLISLTVGFTAALGFLGGYKAHFLTSLAKMRKFLRSILPRYAVSPGAKVYLAITIVGGIWLASPKKASIFVSTSTATFWVHTVLSYLATTFILWREAKRSRFAFNISAVLSLFWVFLGFYMCIEFRRILFIVHPPPSMELLSNYKIWFWNNADYLRQFLFLFASLLTLITYNTRAAPPPQQVAWWRGVISARQAVLLRRAGRDIEDWGKDLPIIGATFKSLLNLWRALRYLKTGAEPIRLCDITFVAGASLGAWALSNLIDIFLREGAMVESGDAAARLPACWLAVSLAFTAMAAALYVLGTLLRETLFLFLTTPFVLFPPIRHVFIDASVRYDFGIQGVLWITAGLTLFLCGILREEMIAAQSTLRNEPPSAGD
jgi:hypothetical protein